MIDDEDFAYERQRQKYIDEMDDDVYIQIITKGKGLPDGDDYELRKLEERGRDND